VGKGEKEGRKLPSVRKGALSNPHKGISRGRGRLTMKGEALEKAPRDAMTDNFKGTDVFKGRQKIKEGQLVRKH